MAYSGKTNWVSGDTVLPADMNRIETGIGAVELAKRDKVEYFLTTGTGSALSISLAQSELVEGREIIVKLHTAILDNATLSCSSSTARNITTPDGVNIKAGAVAGSYLTLVYNLASTKWCCDSIQPVLATQAEAEAGLENTKTTTPLRVFQAIAKWITTTAIGTLGTLSNTAIASTDTVKGALEKLQGQINNKESTIATKNSAFNTSFEDNAVNIKINGTQAVGTLSTVARGDHVHPTDTTREPAITKNTAFNVNFETTATNIKMNGTQALGSLSTVAKADHVHPTDTTRSAKSSKTTATITTTWTGTTAPYTQTISVAGVTTTNIIEISLPSTATQTDVDAFQALNLQDGGQAAGSITLKAYGTKNSASITVNVIVRGDI